MQKAKVKLDAVLAFQEAGKRYRDRLDVVMDESGTMQLPAPELLTKSERIATAAICIVRALQFQHPTFCPPGKRVLFEFLNHRFYRYIWQLVCFVHMAITVWELPPKDSSRAHKYSELRAEGIYVIETMVIDLAICVFYCSYCFLNWRVIGTSRLRHEYQNAGICVISALLALDALVSAIFPGHPRPFRPLRPIPFVLHSPQQAMMATACVMTLIPLLKTFAVLGLAMIFYAIIGLNLLGTYYEDDHANTFGAVCTKYVWENHPFGSIGQAFVTMYVLGAGDNHPDIVWPFYSCKCEFTSYAGEVDVTEITGARCHIRRFIAIVFFFSYLIVVFFCLGNVILATCYYNFETQTKANIMKANVRKRQSLATAFVYLQDNGEVNQQDFLACAKAVRRMYLGFSGDRDADEWFFEALDTSGDGSLELNEFVILPYLMSTKFTLGKSKTPSRLYRQWKRSVLRQQLKEAVEMGPGIGETSYLDIFVMALVLINAFLASSNNTRGGIQNHFADFVTGVFVLEGLAKVAAFGVRTYWANNWNRFDVWITVASLVTFTLARLEEAGYKQEGLSVVFQLVACIRLLRLIKILTAVSVRYSKLINSLTMTIPASINVLTLLVFYMYFSAVIGMEILSPYDTNSRQETTEVGNINYSYDNSHGFDFADFGESFWSVLVIVIGNSWSTILYNAMDAYRWDVCWFFLTLHFMSTFLMMNIIQSLFVFAFVTLMSDRSFSSSFEAELQRFDDKVKQKAHPKRMQRTSNLNNLIISSLELTGVYDRWLQEGEFAVKQLIMGYKLAMTDDQIQKHADELAVLHARHDYSHIVATDSEESDDDRVERARRQRIGSLELGVTNEQEVRIVDVDIQPEEKPPKPQQSNPIRKSLWAGTSFAKRAKRAQQSLMDGGEEDDAESQNAAAQRLEEAQKRRQKEEAARAREQGLVSKYKVKPTPSENTSSVLLDIHEDDDQVDSTLVLRPSLAELLGDEGSSNDPQKNEHETQKSQSKDDGKKKRISVEVERRVLDGTPKSKNKD